MVTALASRAALWTTLFVATVGLAGCGGGTTIQGDVSFDGKPIEEGAISFVSPDGKVTVNEEIRGGKYSIDTSRGVAPGKYKVEVHATIKSGGGSGDPDLQGGGGSQASSAIPAKYNAQSELTADITSGDNTVNFDLKP